jgi:hypothetical protein
VVHISCLLGHDADFAFLDVCILHLLKLALDLVKHVRCQSTLLLRVCQSCCLHFIFCVKCLDFLENSKRIVLYRLRQSLHKDFSINCFYHEINILNDSLVVLSQLSLFLLVLLHLFVVLLLQLVLQLFQRRLLVLFCCLNLRFVLNDRLLFLLV